MAKGGAMAQAQAQKQNTITHEESLQLVRCLLRVSIFHVTYLRGLLPPDHFSEMHMKNLDGMNIFMVKPCSSDEAKTLVDWVENGVYDAVRRGFLKTLYYGISLDPHGTQLLEEYVFDFAYSEDGGVDMQLQRNGGKSGCSSDKQATKFQKPTGASVSSVKYQVSRLIRMLVNVCQTLDEVPEERYLFMKLTYHDHTPNEYEPPAFEAAGDSGVGHFRRRPFTMRVGAVGTDHHSVALRVKSVLDCCDDAQLGGASGREEVQEGLGSQQMMAAEDGGDTTTMTTSPGNQLVDGSMEDAAADGMAQSAEQPRHAGTALAPHEEAPSTVVAAAALTTVQQADVAPDAGPADPKLRVQDDLLQLAQTAYTEPPPETASCGAAQHSGPEYPSLQFASQLATQAHAAALGALQAYCKKRARVSFTSALTQFAAVPLLELEAMFAEMVATGHLAKVGSSSDLYICVQPSQLLAGARSGVMEAVAAPSACGSAGHCVAGPGCSAADRSDEVGQMMSRMSMGGAGGRNGTDGAPQQSVCAASTHRATEATAAPVKSMPPPCRQGCWQDDNTVQGMSVVQLDGCHDDVSVQQEDQGMGEPVLYIDASQVSGKACDAGKGCGGVTGVKRKASCVAKPIHQCKGGVQPDSMTKRGATAPSAVRRGVATTAPGAGVALTPASVRRSMRLAGMK